MVSCKLKKGDEVIYIGERWGYGKEVTIISINEYNPLGEEPLIKIVYPDGSTAIVSKEVLRPISSLEKVLR